MKFKTGKIVGTPGESGKCKNVDGNDYCGKEKIIATNILCKGKEKKIKECAFNLDTTNCGHDLDTII